MLKMELHGVNLDVMTNQPVVILRDPKAERFLPIWIGQFEATAILMELQGVKPSRPLTHDLLKSVIERFQASIGQIVIDDLQDGTFFAKIHVKVDSADLRIDARPSDAIAIALRVQAPLFVREGLFEASSREQSREEPSEELRL